tara:strand:+ start:5666 stop:8434 length:2769 start_codon:yes stop_codon:yes gene_type:complete
MKKTLSDKIAEHTSYGMILITVAFFVTQVYSRIYTTHDGNLMIAFIILGSFLCGKEYGIITGVILSLFVLFMRYNSHLEGFNIQNRCNFAERYAKGAQTKLTQLENEMKVLKGYDLSNAKDEKSFQEYATTKSILPYKGATGLIPSANDGWRVDWRSSIGQCSLQLGRGIPKGGAPNPYKDRNAYKTGGSKADLEKYLKSGQYRWRKQSNSWGNPNNTPKQADFKIYDQAKNPWFDPYNFVSAGYLRHYGSVIGKSHAELLGQLWTVKAYCPTGNVWWNLRTDQSANRKEKAIFALQHEIDTFRKRRNFFLAYYSQLLSKCTAGMSAEQKEVYELSKKIRNLRWEDSSDGNRHKKATQVLNAAGANKDNVTSAKVAYDRLIEEYKEEKKAVVGQIERLAEMAATLPFPFSNSKEAADSRRKLVLSTGTLIGAKNKFNEHIKRAYQDEVKLFKEEQEKRKKAGQDMKALQAEIEKDQKALDERKKDIERKVKEAEKNAAKIVDDALKKIEQDKKDWEALKEREKSEIEAERKKILEAANLDVEKLKKEWDETKAKLRTDAMAKADEEAARLLANAAEKAGGITDKAKQDADALKAQAGEAASRIKDEADAIAEGITREAEAQALNAKARDDATRARLDKYEIELKSERERAESAEKMAQEQRLRLEREIRNAKNAQLKTSQAGINIREELAREREQRAAAENTIFAERQRAQALKEAEVARCARNKAKMEARQRRADRVRKQREQERLEAERRKKEAEEAERRRLMETKSIRMRELAQQRANKLRMMKINLANQANLEKEEDYMNQVTASSGLLSGLGSFTNGGLDPATGAAQLGPDGLPVNFGLDDIYRNRSQNEYLDTGPNDSLYVNRTTLGGYVGPINYELYSSAPLQAAPVSFEDSIVTDGPSGMVHNSGPSEIIKKPF